MQQDRREKNPEEWRGTKMGNRELKNNGKERGVRSKIQNETMLENTKALGTKLVHR